MSARICRDEAHEEFAFAGLSGLYGAAMRSMLLIAVVSFALAACGGSGDTPKVSTTDRVTRSAPAAPAGDCRAAGIEELTQIKILPKPGSAIELDRGAKFTSPDYPDLTFIVAQVTGDSAGEGTVGLWSTADLRPLPPGGTIFQSVDADAQIFTSWPKASDMAMRISSDDPVVAEARALPRGLNRARVARDRALGRAPGSAAMSALFLRVADKP